MAGFITIDHRDFSEHLKTLGLDLRKASRRMVREIGEEGLDITFDKIRDVRRTGQMGEEPELVFDNPWKARLEFNDSRFLDSGSRPHSMPWDDAKEMAPYYGMTTGEFWGMVKNKGTEAHPFIGNVELGIEKTTQKIIEREMNLISWE